MCVRQLRNPALKSPTLRFLADPDFLLIAIKIRGGRSCVTAKLHSRDTSVRALHAPAGAPDEGFAQLRERAASVSYSYKLSIALNLKRIWSDVLDEALPQDLQKLIRKLEQRLPAEGGSDG
jgi:hypothetical protein